jgi:hypothetical protein
MRGIPLLIRRIRKGPGWEHTEIKIGFIAIAWTLLLDVAKPIVLGVIAQRQGYKVDLLMAVFLWSIRPRSAFMSGLLGFFHPQFMEHAIGKMGVDVVFSLPAAAFAINAAFFPNRTKNPAKPIIYKYYQAGAIMMLIPAVIVGLAFLGLSIDHCKLIRLVKYPFREGYTRVRNIGKKEEEKRPEHYVHLSMFKGWYYIFLILGGILFIGSWMVWATFLEMAGDLYCPASLKEVIIVLLVFPVVENAVKLVL